jgi:hypothetical protein
LKRIFDTAWERFNVIASVVSDANARAIAVLFYFTIVVPFGLIALLFSDPFRENAKPQWFSRDPVPTDIDSARQQG